MVWVFLGGCRCLGEGKGVFYGYKDVCEGVRVFVRGRFFQEG